MRGRYAKKESSLFQGKLLVAAKQSRHELYVDDPDPDIDKCSSE